MATPVGQLTIEMAANIVRLQKDMEAARRTVDGAMDSITKTVQNAMRTVGTLFAGVSLSAFAGKLISVEREFGTLNASLITVTGSAREADKAFAMLTDFASTTPFSLQEVTAAFIKLKALGMDPSAEALRSYGNTASAMGKSLNQMIEAVADAATGEFERLKEFGIRAQSEGNRVTLTFRGVSTNIGKNAAEIEGYLRRIGDVDFAGAMDARAKTLDGAISNLGDSWDELFRVINSEMTGPLLMTAVKGAQSAVEGFAGVVKNFAEFIEDNKLTLMAVGAILAAPALLSGIGAVTAAFGAMKIAVVGLTAAFASNPIALAILAITAAAVPAIDGIQRYMNANKDLEREQAALNETQAETERLLRQANPVQQKAVVTTNAQTDAQKAANKEQEKQAQTYQKLINDIEEKNALMKAEESSQAKLTESERIAIKIRLDLENGTLKLNDAQKTRIDQLLEEMRKTEANTEAKKKEIEAAKLANEEFDRYFEILEDGRVAQENAIRSARETVENLEFEARALTMSNTEREIAIELRKLEKDGLDKNSEAYQVMAERIREAVTQKDAIEQNIEQQETLRKEYEKTSQSIENTLTDALMRGFESGKDFGKNFADTLVNMFKTLVLRPIIQPIAQGASSVILSLMGMSAPGTAAAAGGANASTLMQGLQLSMSQFGSYMGTAFMNTIFGTGGGASMTAAQSLYASGNYAQAAGMAGGTLAAYGAGAAVGVYGGRAISNGYAISGSGNGVVNAGTAIGMVLGGPIGAAIGGAIAGGVNRLFGRKQTDMGIQGTLTTSEGIQGQSYKFLKGGLFRSSKTVASALASEVEVLFDSSIELITKQTRSYAAALGLPAEAIDRFTQEIKLSFQGLSEAEINQKIADTLAEFQEGLASQYSSALEPLKIAGETFTQTLQRLIAIQDVSIYLNEFGGAFSNFATASITARQGIIDLAGGLDALIQKTQGFIANFYTREEQAGITARGVVQALEVAGFTASQIAALETRQDFRTLLESIDVSTEIGQKQFVALLDMQASFAGLSTIMEEQQESLLGLIEAAPQVEILQKMFESDSQYQDRLQTAEQMAQATFDNLLLTMGNVDISINNLTNVMANRLDRLASDMAMAQAEANAAAANAIAVANASAAAAIAAANAAEAAAAAQYTYQFDGAATGGYISGPTLVGEHGPEIFDPMRSQIYTAPATVDMLGNGEVAAEIRALRDEVSMMRSETRATAVNTSKIARLQDNWDVRGLTVRTDADQPLDTVTV